MKPAAHVQAVIELLETELESPLPLDVILQKYLRARRYIGSKDRREITRQIYRINRRFEGLKWLAESLTEDVASLPRLLSIADQKLNGLNVAEVQELFSGQQYQPTPLTEPETKFLEALSEDSLESAPEWVKLNTPQWTFDKIKAQFASESTQEIEALSNEATTDLRVNTLKANPSDALKALKENDIEADTTQHSPTGIRLKSRVNLSTLEVYKDGRVEVQDEGAQVVSALCAANPSDRILDYCAGAGGKSLALAAYMANEGEIVAFDIDPRRLDKIKQRARRAGASIIKATTPEELKESQNNYDLVVVDTPCSGTGTWRRNPDQKWRLTPEKLSEYTEIQAEVLRTASHYVKPGGRLTYITCSILEEENRNQVESFLQENQGFELIKTNEVWEEVFSSAYPGKSPEYLTLTPHQHGTDGFFMAVLRKKT